MKDLLRTLVASAVGAIIALAVVVGQPALAAQADKAKAQVTSAMIKNGTIKSKDLNTKVKASLAKADTALQGIPDGSVTTTKLASNAVTSPKIADGSVTAIKLGTDAVTGAKIADGSLTAGDLSVSQGSSGFDVTSLPSGVCTASSGIETGHLVTGDFILISAPATVVGNIEVSGREDLASNTAIDIVWCNDGNSASDPPAATYHWTVISH
jgi:hypothetical protein